VGEEYRSWSSSLWTNTSRNCEIVHWRSVAYRWGGVQPPPPRNSEVLAKLSRTLSSVQNTSVTI
jgi:hypothetical protein